MEQIKIVNSLDSTEIDIEGTIGIAEEVQFDNPQQRVATYERFREQLQQIESLESRSIVVNIRSTGGDVNDALLIYDALTSLSGAVITTRCWGYVASAATIIAQAASEGLREISPNALYLIHNSTSYIEGNASQLEKRLELLRKSDERIAALYATRSGREVEYFAELMGEESGQGRWLSAEEVVEAGLADTIIEQAGVESDENRGAVSEAIANVVDRVRSLFGGDSSQEQDSPLPEGCCVGASVTHDQDSFEASSRSVIAFEQQQLNFKRSDIEQIEDPPISEQIARSANQHAYDNDLKRLRRVL